jgi:uncharacterized LabA/DUF88 family protein
MKRGAWPSRPTWFATRETPETTRKKREVQAGPRSSHDGDVTTSRLSHPSRQASGLRQRDLNGRLAAPRTRDQILIRQPRHRSMNGRQNRQTAGRAGLQPIHRAPQAGPPPVSGFHHAPNAALLIDFDNVTMGIRSDLQTELRTLLASDIIKGKVAVQRAYADWRRYPQYIVPLAEASIDMIMAPAYGSSKKNATDIRLAIDALELVFTRPEIGTFILLSGDSDFSSLVIKLKEYGKYVIGVGIRESSSDLLVMNCDEYFSYTSLAGLVNRTDEEVQKWDPWTLVSEAIQRMKRNGDVMRSDRLKQVMQDIDPAFDEKNLGMSKFSKFTAEAANRGLLSATRLENGQYEVGLPGELAGSLTPGLVPPVTAAVAGPAATPAAPRNGERPAEDRGRRRGRGRGRGRDRERTPREGQAAVPAIVPPVSISPVAVEQEFGRGGQRLTRDEAFALVRRSVEALGGGAAAPRLADVRRKAFELLGRDSESLDRRMFERILRDAHDANVVDLRRRGDDFEVVAVNAAEPAAEEAVKAGAAHPPVAEQPAVTTPARGMGPRGAIGRVRGGRMTSLPPELLAVGIVDIPSTTPAAAPGPEGKAEEAPEKKEPAKTERRRSTRKAVAKKATDKDVASLEKPDRRRKPRAKKATAAAPKAEAAGDQAESQDSGGTADKPGRKQTRTRRATAKAE